MKFALLIEYDGTDFSGWQVQPNERTVQGELESAFGKLTGAEVAVVGAGRTDAGVHASGMVAHVDLAEREDLPKWKVIEAINALTTEDVVLRDMRPVGNDFHARFSATERSYTYRITRDRVAIGRMYSWYVWRELDLAVMNDCILYLHGEHDFTSFSKLSDDVAHYRCILTEARINAESTGLTVHLSANRFVRGMVRALVGALIEVGKGRLSGDQFRSLVDEPEKLQRAKFICPAQGLTFCQAKYPDEFGLWRAQR